jgi:hypothetical protein
MLLTSSPRDRSPISGCNHMISESVIEVTILGSSNILVSYLKCSKKIAVLTFESYSYPKKYAVKII